MPEPVKISDLPIEHPADAAWEKYKAAQMKASGGSYSDTEREVFGCGWNAALAWLPFRIQQFREIEEALRKEIEELKSQNTAS